MWIHIKNTYKYNSITKGTFHEQLPDDDPAGLKHVANTRIHNKMNGNKITSDIY